MLAALTTDDWSRIAALAALASSVTISTMLAVRLHAVFAWHLVLIAVWSVVAAVGMVALMDITPAVTLPAFTEVLNLSWSLTVAGWAVFVWRLHRTARHAAHRVTS